MTASEPGAPGRSAAEADRQLHPASALFVLVTRLKPWILPLIVLLVFGRGESWMMTGAAITILFGLHAVLLTARLFRYRVDGTELYVREGVLSRTERHVPFARIQNVSLKRHVLHRLLGVTDLVLESATGGRPEAVMSVISMAEAARVQDAVRGVRAHQAGAAASEAAAPEPAGDVLLALPSAELARHGIVSNRGMVVVGAALGVLWSFDVSPYELPILRDLWALAVAEAEAVAMSWQGRAAGAVTLVVALVVALRGLSVLLSLVTLHGFRLERRGDHIQTEAGLLTRIRSGALLDKVQRFIVEEALLHRMLGRQSLRVDVAGARRSDAEGESIRLKWLAPIAPRDRVTGLIGELSGGVHIGSLPWQPLHPRAWRRKAVPGALLAIGAWTASSIVGHAQDWGAPAIGIALAGLAAALALDVLGARGWARFTRFAITDRVIAFRSGWLRREWTILPIAKVQARCVVAGPLDRWNRMGRILLDAAGTDGMGHAIAIPYLPEAQAAAMFEQLRRELGTPVSMEAEPEMHYLLFYDDVDDYVERRAATRAEHLQHAQAAVARGELLLGGAVAEPVDGAVLLFSGDAPGAAEEFARTDPYVRAGLVTSWRVRPWTTVVGSAAALRIDEKSCAQAPEGPPAE